MEPMSLIALASTLASIYGGAKSAKMKEEYQDELKESQEQYAGQKKEEADKNQLTAAIKRSLGIKDSPAIPGMAPYKAPDEPDTGFYDTMQGIGRLGATAATSQWAQNAYPSGYENPEAIKRAMRQRIEQTYGY